MENIYFSKLIKDGSQESETKTLLYVKSKWSEMTMEIIIYSSETNETFKGELSAEQMSANATDLEIPMQQFYDECQEAITAKILGGAYLYRLEDDFFKLVKKQAFEIELLEVPLKKLTNPVQILDTAFEEISKLKEKNVTNESLAQDDEISTKETLETLRNCLKEKEETEVVLLKKFLMLLNTKKEEIVKLKHQLEATTGNHNESSSIRRQQQSSDDDEVDEFDADTQPFPIDEAMEA